MFSKVIALPFVLKSRGPRIPYFPRYSLAFWPKIEGSQNSIFSEGMFWHFAKNPRVPEFQVSKGTLSAPCVVARFRGFPGFQIFLKGTLLVFRQNIKGCENSKFS